MIRVVAFGQAGNDEIRAEGLFALPVGFYGGVGNDRLFGGVGPSILDGGSGNDQLKGGNNRDLLIGGIGADELKGQAGDDILLAGDFMPSSRFEDRQTALRQLLDAWVQPTPYLARTAALQSTILAAATDDDSVDDLNGGDGFDWFVGALSGPFADRVKGRSNNEFVVDLRGP